MEGLEITSSSDTGKRFAGEKGYYSMTEDVSDRLLRSIYSNGLTEAEKTQVVSAVKEYHC